MPYNLYSSVLCRLCAEAVPQGISLEAQDPEGKSIYELINTYLPLKTQNSILRAFLKARSPFYYCYVQPVDNDGVFPRTICQPCQLQLQNTVNFIRVLIKGQRALRSLYRHITEDIDEAHKGSFYNAEHGMRKEINSTELDEDRMVQIMPPKRKRGRPRKDEAKPSGGQMEPAPSPSSETLALAQQVDCVPELREDEESQPEGKRRRKKPARFMEAIEGKELEKVFRENGVVEDLSISDSEKSLPGVKEEIGRVQNDKGEFIGIVEAVTDALENPPRQKLQFRCDKCQSTFIQESKFIEHAATHYLNMCARCDECFPSAEELEKHSVAAGHRSVNEIEDETPVDRDVQPVSQPQDVAGKTECPVCHENFKFAANLKNHMKTEHNDIVGGFPCDICGKRMKHPSSMLYHKEAEHGVGRRFVCIKCNLSFKHRRLLHKHQIVHNKANLFSCPECKKCFKTKAYLNVHLQFHKNGKRHECGICNQIYSSKHSLITHMRTHTREKLYECFCGKTFIQNGNLQEHVRIHTGEKPFKCDICGRAFTTSSQKRNHVRRHYGEKPFKCDVCMKAFGLKDALNIHMRRHTGEKPYQCETCKKTFAELSAVRKHVRIHTGERPFVCTLCGKAFSDNSNFSKHRKIHRGAEEDVSVSDILADGLTLSNDLALVNAAGDKEFWAVVKQSSDSQDGKDSEAQQVIYITYNDPDDPNSKVSEALLVSKDGLVDNDAEVNSKEDSVDAAREKPAISPRDQMTQLSPLRQGSQNEVPLEGQVVMDEHGNPLRFTTADGGIFHVTTVDGESLQLTGSDGSSIPVRITTADGETLTPAAGVDIASIVGDVTDDPMTSTVVDPLELVSSADVRLLSEAALNFLPLT